MLTLTKLAGLLQDSEDPAMGILKSALLRDAKTPGDDLGNLTLASADDVAQVLAFVATIASLSNEKDTLKALKAQFSGPELQDQFNALDAKHPAMRLKRAKAGELVLDVKDKIPVFELDGKKVGPLLRDAKRAFAAAATLDLEALVASVAFKDAFAGRVSHPTKLSSTSGNGGFFKTSRVEIPSDFGSVTEEDYLTRETVTLACNAAYQKMWSLLLPIVSFEGRTYRLATLLAERADVAAAVSRVLVDNGVAQGPALVDALRTDYASATFGEPQVFAGDLPEVERLSVLAPYGMFNEMARAKKAVQAEYEADHESIAALIQAEIDQVEARVEALAEPASKEQKKAAAEEKKALAEKLKKLKADKKFASTRWLSIPLFKLQFGGANPRNLAMDLDTSIHDANVQVYVPTPRNPELAIGRKAFVPKSLVAAPTLRKFDKLPRYLAANATGAALTRARRDLFADLIAGALAPLKQLQDAWRTRSQALVGEVALGADAQGEIELRDAAWSLFVKGDESLNNKEAAERLRPLTEQVARAAKMALQHACGEDLPATHDAELTRMAQDAVALERA